MVCACGGGVGCIGKDLDSGAGGSALALAITRNLPRPRPPPPFTQVKDLDSGEQEAVPLADLPASLGARLAAKRLSTND